MSRTLLVVFVACSVALLGCEKSEGGASKGSAQAAEKTAKADQKSEKSEASPKEEGPFTQVGALALDGLILGPDGLAFSNDSSKLYVAFADIPAVGVFAIDVD